MEDAVIALTNSTSYFYDLSLAQQIEVIHACMDSTTFERWALPFADIIPPDARVRILDIIKSSLRSSLESMRAQLSNGEEVAVTTRLRTILSAPNSGKQFPLTDAEIRAHPSPGMAIHPASLGHQVSYWWNMRAARKAARVSILRATRGLRSAGLNEDLIDVVLRMVGNENSRSTKCLDR